MDEVFGADGKLIGLFTILCGPGGLMAGRRRCMPIAGKAPIPSSERVMAFDHAGGGLKITIASSHE